MPKLLLNLPLWLTDHLSLLKYNSSHHFAIDPQTCNSVVVIVRKSNIVPPLWIKIVKINFSSVKVAAAVNKTHEYFGACHPKADAISSSSVVDDRTRCAFRENPQKY